MATQVEGIPEEHTDLDSMLYGIAQDLYNLKLICCPKSNGLFIEPFGPQYRFGSKILGCYIPKRSCIISAHHRQLNTDIPTSQQNIFLSSKKSLAHRKH